MHSQFIKRIKALLPQTQRPPIIITDAGFRSTWFRLIAEQGGHWTAISCDNLAVRGFPPSSFTPKPPKWRKIWGPTKR